MQMHDINPCYFCGMENQTTEPGGECVIIINQCQYAYTIRPFEVTNSLGFVRAVLQEYLVKATDGHSYKLYRTTEGNWYDVDHANPVTDAAILLSLKMELDYTEKRK